MYNFRGTWVAQSAKRLASASVMISRLVSSRPTSCLPLPLSLCPSPAHAFSPSKNVQKIFFSKHKARNSMVLVYAQTCATIITNSRICSSPQKETPYPLAIGPILHPGPQPLTTTDLLSAPVDSPILDASHKTIIRYVAFGVWLLGFSITFSRFIYVVARVRTPFLFMAE